MEMEILHWNAAAYAPAPDWSLRSHPFHLGQWFTGPSVYSDNLGC